MRNHENRGSIDDSTPYLMKGRIIDRDNDERRQKAPEKLLGSSLLNQTSF